MKSKYYALVDKNEEIVSLDDTRKDDSQYVTISTSAIYPTKLDANRMKMLLEKTMKQENLVTVKEITIK